MILNSLSLKVIKWCEERKLSILAVHLPGKMNVSADRESRVDQISHDWMLNPAAVTDFKLIWKMEIELFAANWNAQFPKFEAQNPQPGSFATDAFGVG